MNGYLDKIWRGLLAIGLLAVPLFVFAQTPTYFINATADSYEQGERVQVTWTREGRTSSSKDWIGLYRAGAANDEYLAWRYLPISGSSGEVFFTETGEVGAYEVRVFLRNDFIEGGNVDFFTVTRSDDFRPYAIDVVDPSIESGDSVEADWTAPRNRSTSQDWIGLYRLSSGDRRFIDFEYLPDDESEGSVSFKITGNGEYQLRMFQNNDFIRVAESRTIQVGPRTRPDEEYDLEVRTLEIAPGETAEVEWSAPLERSRRDWIGLFERGARDEDYLQYRYLGSRYTEGVVEFKIDRAGRYEVRLFEDNSFEEILEADDEIVVRIPDGEDSPYQLTRLSDPVIAGRNIRVSWEKPSSRSSSRDWIGIYAAGASDQEYLDFVYLPARTGSGEVTIPAPRTPGTYEVRLFIDNDFIRVAQTSSFSVIPDPVFAQYELTLNQTSGIEDTNFSVNWTVPAGEALQLDWIGLFREGTTNRDYLAYEYVDGQESGTATFTIQTPGRYVFRYLKNNEFDSVIETPVFEVLDAEAAGYVCRGLNLATVTNYPNNNGPLIALGDSLTMGYGASEGQDFVSELERRLGVTIENQGVSGDTTVDALARLETDVLSKDPATVLVLLGGNDEIRRLYERIRDRALERNRVEQLDAIAEALGYDWMNKPLLTRDETFENLNEIVTRIQDGGAEVIVIGLDADLIINDFKRRYERLAAETGSLYVEDVLDGILTRSALRSDIVHPNDAGYDVVADRIEPSLDCLLTIPGG